MSIAIWSIGDIVTAKVYKSLESAPDKVWANTYEFRLGVESDEPYDSNEALALALANWEAQFHLEDVKFERVVLSTYVPDSQPYSPDSFVSVPIVALNGQRDDVTSDQLPLNVCLRVKKGVLFGRVGFQLYRRCLVEGDVVAPSGTYSLVDGQDTLLNGLLNGLYLVPPSETATTLWTRLDNLSVRWVMASGNPTATSVRTVQGVSVAGVTIKAFNNRYFDRTNV